MVDGADTVTLGDGDLDEAVNTPGGTPGVTDEPVLETAGLISAVTDNGDGVVGGDAALLGVENTTGVVVEDGAAGIDGDGDGLLGDGNLHAGGGLRLDADVGGESDIRGLILLVGALTIGGCVSPVFLEVGVVGHEVGVGIVGHATAATVVGSHTVDELLLGQGYETAAEDGVGGLDGTSGGEGPAGATAALIASKILVMTRMVLRGERLQK